MLHICQWKRSFLHFSIFLSFHSKWLRKLEMKCRLRGLRWKDQLFQQRYVDFLATTVGLSLLTETYPVWYYSLGQKVFRSLHFLAHRRPTLQIWHHSDPSPHPSLVKDVQSGAKMFRLHFNIVCWAERGKYVEWTVLYRDVVWNWTYNVVHFSKHFYPSL